RNDYANVRGKVFSSLEGFLHFWQGGVAHLPAQHPVRRQLNDCNGKPEPCVCCQQPSGPSWTTINLCNWQAEKHPARFTRRTAVKLIPWRT
ncbi:MAG TPA: hypothetical protein VNR51_12445, partial [Hyphomicrobium sp.]|nr:hypothetical protein [Hyphomicrobium sp.]